MADNCSSGDKTADITTCSICLEPFKEPKALPCLHTFCLQCLVSYCDNQKQEQDMSCPLCSKAFTMPPGGIQDLPNNFFINQLLNVTKACSITEAQESVKPLPCELCSDANAEVPSTSYCVDCGQNMCDRCSMTHKKANSSKSHQVVLHADLSSSQQKRVKFSYCERHPGEQNRLYCYDCKEVMCHKCMSMHSQHQICDVDEAGEQLRDQLGEDIIALTTCINKQQTCREQLELDAEAFLKEVASAESAVLEKCEQLVALLMKEISQVKEKKLKEVATKKEDMEKRSTITENFKADCFEIWSKGTAYDVARAARDLHIRAQELVKAEDDFVYCKLSGASITLKPSLSNLDRVEKFTRKLVLGDEASTMKVDQVPEQMKDQNQAPINLTEFLTNPTLLHVMPAANNEISGITVLGKEVFLVRNSSAVHVYKSDDFSWIRDIKITGSKRLSGIVGCSHYNCLYCNDWGQTIIYRYDLVNEIATSWSVGSKCYDLSLAKSHNVLITIASNPKRIQEYTTDGILVKEFIIDAGLDKPGHCVQLSTDNIAIFDYGPHRRVCILDNVGRIIHCYWVGNAKFSILHQLTVDADDNVLVTDSDTNDSRLQLLSSTLTYLGDITIPGHQLDNPYASYFDVVNRRLYIGEWKGKRMFVLGV